MKTTPWVMGSMLVLGLVTAGGAQAQRYRDDAGYRDDSRYYDDRNSGDVGYDYARVVRVDPVIVRDPAREAPRCYDRPAQGSYGGGGDYYGGGYGGASTANPAGRNLATVIGGVAGAVVGSRFGGGSGQILGTAVGTVAGGLAGQSVYDANHPQDRSGYVRVCDPAPEPRESVDGYDVTYEYGGRTYRTHSDYNPGDRIRVRVEAAPE
ncbi:glycine zipper 2TM domain-containing protein [Stenotrophomonas sp. HITSZ_GD]|uniref:glycine zipper 2TM domain-containing protein n=1 Tax=Stenotrophomonas sp. HITSZ_GD TaxID=3037248 RepID=UPI00240E19D7|nr:glycine zipper 2TM domain-containing protein [Stenotrophomonas sp. HITSZ_GD]MDG2525549.1 glycine zipper 2TM domain-containing protein [Stenotrophomonas sp. HITSZ_GD]